MDKFLIKKKSEQAKSLSTQPSTSTATITSEGTSAGLADGVTSMPFKVLHEKTVDSTESRVSSSSSSTDESRGETPAKRKKKSYLHKYRQEWKNNEEFKAWISESKQGNQYFYCKICNGDYIGGLSAVKKHSNSKKHIFKMKTLFKQKTLTESSFKSSNHNILKQNEIRIAAFVAEHNLPVNISDHLTELTKSICASGIAPSQLRQMSCGRTKCTAIINNVLGKTNFENLIGKLKINKFSLLVDESTDISAEKVLAIVVRINENFTTTDEFLTLITVSDTTAQNLYRIITDFFKSNNIPYEKNIVGFGADGANTMMGAHHSLKTLLQQDIPDLFVMKCICHSLALCASYACNKIPDIVEKLIRNVFSYMQHSFKRQSHFKEFQDFLNIKPHKMLQPSQTRWLSVQSAVIRVLEQYEALKMFFRTEAFDKASNAIDIQNLLENPVNKLYLEFLEYVLPIFNNMNLEFQSERPKIQVLYSQMANAYKLLLSFYIKPEYLNKTELKILQYRNPEYFVPIEKVYLGPKVSATLNENILITEFEKKQFRLNCLSFYTEAAHQIFKRFPFNSKEVEILKLVSFIDPKNIESTETIGHLGSMFPRSITDSNILDREFRALKTSEFDFSLEAVQFWKSVCTSKKGDGTPLFSELPKLISILLTLPHSSACVERQFSLINLNKTKLRNRLSSETLSGILHSKRLISESNCYDFSIDKQILNKHNNSMYSSSN